MIVNNSENQLLVETVVFIFVDDKPLYICLFVYCVSVCNYHESWNYHEIIIMKFYEIYIMKLFNKGLFIKEKHIFNGEALILPWHHHQVWGGLRCETSWWSPYQKLTWYRGERWRTAKKITSVSETCWSITQNSLCLCHFWILKVPQSKFYSTELSIMWISHWSTNYYISWNRPSSQSKIPKVA